MSQVRLDFMGSVSPVEKENRDYLKWFHLYLNFATPNTAIRCTGNIGLFNNWIMSSRYLFQTTVCFCRGTIGLMSLKLGRLF